MSHAKTVQVICTIVVRAPFDADIVSAWEKHGKGVDIELAPKLSWHKIIFDNQTIP